MNFIKWFKKTFNKALRVILLIDLFLFLIVIYCLISPRLVRHENDTYCIKNNYFQDFAIDEWVRIGFKNYHFGLDGKMDQVK